MNEIGAEGWKAIAEALKINTSLTLFSFEIKKDSLNICVSHFQFKAVKLGTMNAKSLVRHSRQTLHSRNLILE